MPVTPASAFANALGFRLRQRGERLIALPGLRHMRAPQDFLVKPT